MALTGSETFGTVIPGFVTDADGRLSVTTNTGSTQWREGFLRDYDGRLVVAEAGGIMQDGLLRTADGALCVTTGSVTNTGTMVPGLPTDDEGRICVANDGTTADGLYPGFKFDGGKLCVTGLQTYEKWLLGAVDPVIGTISSPATALLPLGATDGLIDRSSNGHDGTAVGGISVGGVTPGPLRVGDEGATNFDGANDLITTTYQCFVNNTARTFMGWAWRDTSSSNDALFGSSSTTDFPMLYLPSSSTNVQWRPQNSGSWTLWTSAWPGNNQWVHWVFVYNETSDESSLYINGALVSTQTVSNSYSASPGNFQLGGYGTGTNPFDGKQAWVSVHEDELSAGDIEKAYQLGHETP